MQLSTAEDTSCSLFISNCTNLVTLIYALFLLFLVILPCCLFSLGHSLSYHGCGSHFDSCAIQDRVTSAVYFMPIWILVCILFTFCKWFAIIILWYQGYCFECSQYGGLAIYRQGFKHTQSAQQSKNMQYWICLIINVRGLHSRLFTLFSIMKFLHAYSRLCSHNVF